MITAVNTTGFLINWSYIDTDTNTWNTTQEMINAVNGTYLTVPNINVTENIYAINSSVIIQKIGTWCQYENSTGSLVFERNC